MDDPPADERPQRASLEYYTPPDPDWRRRRGLTVFAVLLLIGWLPFACGVINASTIWLSYSPAVIREHVSGAIAFLAIGMMCSLAALIGFWRLRHTGGVIAAGAVLLVQLVLTGCTGATAIPGINKPGSHALLWMGE